MARAFYSEYVNHCLRFYARHQNAKFKSAADKHNWEACDNALKGFTDSDRAILLQIYSDGDTVADNVYQISKAKGINQNAIWKLVNELERKVAKRRGLL